MKVCLLFACRNRKKTTLRLLSAIDKEQLEQCIDLLVVAVDDGSTDGTSSAIAVHHPDVAIVQGDGSLFWAGGMRHGWEVINGQIEFDALIVANDDIELRPGALNALIVQAVELSRELGKRFVLVAPFGDPQTGYVTYGGYNRRARWNPMSLAKATVGPRMRRVVTMNMNLAIVPADVLREVGFLAPYFVHSGADIEFGFRCSSVGIPIYLQSQLAGTCARNSLRGGPHEDGISRLERIRRFNAPKSQPWRQRLAFVRAHGGRFWPLVFLIPYAKIALLNKV